MSIFEKFKKKEIKQETPEEIKSYGWDAITEICEKAYPAQKNPLHYGTFIKCICSILQSIARITFTKSEIFNVYEYLYIGQ